MQLLVFNVLFLLSVVKSYSKPITVLGTIPQVSCSSDLTKYDATKYNSSSSQISTGWKEDYLYPIEACVTIIGEEIRTCRRTNESKIEMLITPYAAPGSISQSIPLTVPIDPNQFNASKVFCHTFNASDIASVMEGKNLTGARVALQALFIAFERKTDYYQLSVRAAPYYIDKLGGEAIPDKGYKHHAVVCKFPRCVITAEGPSKIIKIENFHVEKLAPRYEKEYVQLTDKMFSVTYFECEAQCPTKFVASAEHPQPDKPVPEFFPKVPPSPPKDTTTLAPEPVPEVSPKPPPAPPVQAEPSLPEDTDAQVPLAAVTTEPSNAPYHLSVGTFAVAAILLVEA